jgi:hypothetical protein
LKQKVGRQGEMEVRVAFRENKENACLVTEVKGLKGRTKKSLGLLE